MLKIPYLTIKQWRKSLRQLTKNHMYKIDACKVIADKFKVNPNTVRYCLFQRKGYLNRKDYEEKYRNRPNIYIKRKNYDLKYKSVVRHIDNLFPQIFNSNPELPLSEISGRIDNLTGVHLKETTLETLLNKYNGKARDPPLIKTESGNYKLNSSFYKN